MKLPISHLGICRNTVKRLILLKEEPKYTREQYATKVDPYMDLIRRTSSEYDFNGTNIFRELKARRYTGMNNLGTDKPKNSRNDSQ